MRPNCRTTRSAIACTPRQSVTSAPIATAPGNAAAVSRAFASSRSVTTTAAPSVASFPAIALPMPWPAPVTIAILSMSLPMNGSSQVSAYSRPDSRVMTSLEGLGQSCLTDGNTGQAAAHPRHALSIYQRIEAPGARRGPGKPSTYGLTSAQPISASSSQTQKPADPPNLTGDPGHKR